ncbi:hypothetical protein, partial [Salmonella sp. SAL4359]|uniref:hypothetical protein n=1 Tax=Salmonella sp. SAL4359 TaxID=3159880 RepID=UPI00397DC8CF
MHYTGMTAAIFTAPHSNHAAMSIHPSETIIFGILLGLAAFIILGFVLMSAVVDRRFSTQTATFESLFLHSTDMICALDHDGTLL